MRICFVIGRFHPHIGGTERQARNLGENLIDRGDEVFVLTGRWDRSLPSAETVGRITVRRLPVFGAERIASLILSVSLLAWLLWNFRRYDLIHCHLMSTLAAVCALAGRLTGKKTVVKLGGRGDFGDVHYITRVSAAGALKLRFLRENVSFFACPTEEIRAELAGAGIPADKIAFLPNGVDTGRFRPPASPEGPAAARKRLGSGEYCIVFTGRLATEKNAGVLIEAFPEIVARFPGCTLMLVGDGPLLEDYLRRAAQVPGGERIRFPGATQDTRAYLEAASVFVLPSISEGLSNALLEAMASGLPVVASALPGNRTLVRDGDNGLLFDPRSPRSLAETICRVLERPEEARRLGRNARLTIEGGFTIAAVTNGYRELYEKALQGENT